MGEVDKQGNVNVTKFGQVFTGCGGFINISQNAKKVVFCGTFTSGGLKIQIREGKVNILKEGKHRKFVNQVQQISFSGEQAIKRGQEVLFVTERGVFELTESGVILVEIAPGVDIEKDIARQMEFDLKVADELKSMDKRIFQQELMGIKFTNSA